jgi:glycopeptide antibiotics resistance protein
MSSKKERAKTGVIYGMMILYVIFLLFTMFFAVADPISGYAAVRENLRGVSLVPFRSIAMYLRMGGIRGAVMINLLGNVVMFMPLGFYAAALRKDKRILTNLLCVFAFSLSAEIMQYIFARGISDIDDLLLNCLGGLLGIFICGMLSSLIKNEAKVRTVIAVLSAVAVLPILLTFAESAKVFFEYAGR